jgi:hypothetical protein
MARDPYSAAAAGLESGFGLGMRAREQERAEKRDRDAASERAAERTAIDEQRVYQRSRDVKADERAAKQDEERAKAARRQEGIDKLRVLDSEIDELGKEGTALWSQYGGYDKVPEDVRGDFVKRTKEARGRRSAARRSFYEPDVQATRREAAETASRLEAGQLTLDQLTPDQLYKTIQVQARRPMADFIRTDPAKPSAIEQAGLDLEAGMQTGNRDMIMRAANVLLAPELKVGIGSEGRDGSEIIEKKIVQLVPHPQDPNQIVPLLEVKVRRDDGSIGSYLAPVTEGRGVYGSDPQATPKAITMQAALDRVGQLTTTAAFVNRPDVRKFIDQAGEGKASADEFLASMGLLGIAPPKKQVTRERVDLGGSVLERTVDASGNIIGEKRLGKTAAPGRVAGDGPTAEEKNMAAAERRLAAGVKEGLITPEEAKERRRALALGGGGKGSMDSPKAAFDAENKLRDEHTKQSGTFVKVRDAMGKVQVAAKDPSAAGDIALIFSYMRILDPDSVVREGEFATAQNAASIPDRVRNLYNKALSGERLNDKQRADMVNQAKKVYGSQKQGQDKLDKQYTELATGYGLNPKNVVQKFDTEVAPELPPAARSALKEGQVTTFGNGQKWTLKGGEPVQVQ